MLRPSTLLAATLAVALGGCVAEPPQHLSTVESTNFRDASRLTVAIADILAANFTPAKTTLAVRPLAGNDPMRVALLLEDSLRERGFALAPSGMDYPGAHRVRYSITPIDSDIELALDVDQGSATCVFDHDADGGLTQVGGCSVLSGGGVTLRIPVHVMPHASERPVHPMTASRSGPLNILPGKQAIAPAAQTRNPKPQKPTSQVEDKKKAAKVIVATPKAAQKPVAPTPPPPPPAITPTPVLQTWSLVGGQPIRDQMLAWGDRAGWHVIWPDHMNWMVPVTTAFSGGFEGQNGVIAQVVRALSAQGKPLRLRLFKSNHVALVEKIGDPR